MSRSDSDPRLAAKILDPDPTEPVTACTAELTVIANPDPHDYALFAVHGT